MLYSTIQAHLLFPAGPRSAVDGRGALRRDEAPVVAVGSQGEREHPDRVGPADLAARVGSAEAAQVGPTGADDELHRSAPDPPVGVPWGEALVVVIMTVEYDVDAAVVQLRPQRRQRRVVAVLGTGREPRPVEGRHRAPR